MNNQLRRSNRIPIPNSKYLSGDYLNSADIEQNEMAGQDDSVEALNVNLPDTDDDLQAELDRMEEEVIQKKVERDAATAKAAKKDRILQLRKECNELQEEVTACSKRSELGQHGRDNKNSRVSAKKLVKSATISGPSKHVTVKEVRQATGKKSVRKLASTLAKGGVNILAETDDESDTDLEGEWTDDDNLSFISYSSKGSKSRQLKTKIPTDHSATPWPHEFINLQHTNDFKAVPFQSLDLRLLTLGELEIFKRSNQDEEANARLDWLNTLLTHAGNFEWQAILRTHHCILTQLGKGLLTWHDDFSRIAYSILLPHPITRKPKPQQMKNKRDQGPDKLFCNKYNSAEGCTKSAPHKMLFFGKEATALHICSACFRKDKLEANHPATSPDCPNK